jgi:hypothetical protein
MRSRGNAHSRHKPQPEASARIDHSLEEHLALRARLGNVLDVIAGIHVNAKEMEADVRGIQANTRLLLRSGNLLELIDRAKTSLDRGASARA